MPHILGLRGEIADERKPDGPLENVAVDPNQSDPILSNLNEEIAETTHCRGVARLRHISPIRLAGLDRGRRFLGCGFPADRDMYRRTFDINDGAFSDGDTRSLRAVYLLAVSALRHTHHVDELVMSRLADSVLKAYGRKRVFRSSISHADIENMAISSIEIFVDSCPELLVMKH